MADNANTTVGILSLMAKFDEGSVTEAARIANKSVEKAEKQISGFNLDKGLVENFEKAMKYVEKAIKKENVNLSKYTSNLITNLFNVEDAKDAEKALNNFIKPIETLEKLSKNLDLSLFNPKQLDEFIAKQEKINTLIKEEEQIKTNKEYEIQRRDEIKADNEKVRSIEKIISAYKKIDSTEKEMLHNSLSKEQTNAIKTRIKAQQNLSKEQEEQIKNYSELITLYQIMSNNVPKKPTDKESALELVNYRKEMLKVATAIREAETEISSFSKKADFSTNLKFTVNNSEMALDQAISFYFKNIKDYIKEERNKAEEELNKYIRTVSTENQTARNKAEVKNETYIAGREKVIARKRSDNKGSFANDGYSGEKYTTSSSNIITENLEQEEQAYLEVDKAIEKYIVDLETAKKMALEASKSKQLQGANVTKSNVQDFKDLVGYAQRYIDLGGKLEDIGLDSTAMRIVNGKATLHFDSDVENLEEFRKAISKVVNAEKSFEDTHENLSSANGNTSKGFVQSKEEAEQLLVVLNGLNEAISLFNTKVNSIDGTTDNEFSKQLLEQKDEIKETFGAISNAITVELQEAFTDFSNNLNNLDERDWTFEKLRESLLNIVQQFQNSLQAVGLSSTQLDEAYKTIKGWNDADASMAKKNNITHGERGALLNSKNGQISNSFFSDAEHSFGDALFNSIKELSAGIDGEINTIYDTWVHSHPFRKAIDGIKTIGSDIGFSVADLDLGIEKLLKDKLPNMLVSNNYKYTNLDLTDVSEEITKQFLEEYKKELLSAGLTEELIDGKKKITFPNKLAKHDGVYDFDSKTTILNDALKRAMSTVGLDHSRLTSGNIEDLKVDMTQLQTETNETENNAQELYVILDKIAKILSEISSSGGFKFEGLEQIIFSLSAIGEKIQIIHDKSENTSTLPLSEDKNSVLSSDNNPSSTSVDSEVSDLSKLDNKLNETTDKVNNKTAAFEREGQTVTGVVDREVSDLVSLDGQIELIIQDIKKLSDAIEQLPKIQIELDNQIDSEGNILDENLVKQFDQIKLVFDNLNVGQITSVLETLKKFKISDKASSNLQKLANALLNFKSNLNNFSNESKEVLYLLESLVSQAENLKNFSKGLNNAFSEIKRNASSSNGNNKPKELTAEEKEEQRVKDIAKAYDDLSSNLQRYYALKNKELKGTLAKTNKLDERTELIELSSSVQNAVSGQGEYANATGKAAIAQAEFNKKLQEYAELSGENFKEGIFSKLIKLSSAEGKTPEYYSQLEEIEEKIKTLLAFLPIDFTNTSEIQQLKEAQTEIEKLIKPLSGKQFNAVSIAQVEDLSTKISKLLSKNSAMPKALKEQLINLRQSLNGINNQVDLSKAIDEFKTLEAQIEKTGKTGISMGDKIKRKFKDLFAYAATYVSIQDGIQMAKQAYQYVAEIDKQMIELEKVTEASNSRVAQSFDNSTASAKELGSTISDVISATADWSRLGYNIDQSEKLAEVATIYKNVGDGIDMDSANESLISTLQGFQMEAEDAIEIVDKFNEVANNFPTSSSGIGIALQRSAASFNAANTDLSQSIALIVGSNSVLQDEEKVGVKYCQRA